MSKEIIRITYIFMIYEITVLIIPQNILHRAEMWRKNRTLGIFFVGKEKNGHEQQTRVNKRVERKD